MAELETGLTNRNNSLPAIAVNGSLVEEKKTEQQRILELTRRQM